MQKTKWHILSTRPLSNAVKAQAAAKNIVIDESSFIETTAITNDALTKKIQALATQNITTVFTSMNAVEAVAAMAQKKTGWPVYSIGTTTTELVTQKLSNSIKATAPDAATLAQAIIDADEKEVYFFCGNIRRDVLPQMLEKANITVHEFVVYQTTATPAKIDKTYDAILFYSPSAVESFFSMNTANQSTALFAIGATTADALKPYSNNIIIAQSTGKEALVQQMIAHFNP